MTELLTAIDLDEFTRAAGLDLNAEQTADLQEMLHLHPESRKWRWPTWTVTDHNRRARDLLAARALIGLLILDENILWTAREHLELKDAFRRLEANVNQLGTMVDVPIKFRRVNGEERIERLDTGKRIKFACTQRPGSARGYSCDLLVVGEGVKNQHIDDLLPSMATRPNPQIVYVR